MSHTSPKYALFITGNPGSGKSFIASGLGAHFHSGFSGHGGGVTSITAEEQISIQGDQVLMIDAPGLIEVDLAATQRNAGEIAKAIESHPTVPYKIGVVVTDQNGRLQQADMVLIRNLSNALQPGFELFLIVNQIRKRNLDEYLKTEYMHNLLTKIHESTGVVITRDRVIPIVDFGDDEVVDMNPLIHALESVPATLVKTCQTITISEEEHQSVGDRIEFYRFAQVKTFTEIASSLASVSPAPPSFSFTQWFVRNGNRNKNTPSPNHKNAIGPSV